MHRVVIHIRHVCWVVLEILMPSQEGIVDSLVRNNTISDVIHVEVHEWNAHVLVLVHALVGATRMVRAAHAFVHSVLV